MKKRFLTWLLAVCLVMTAASVSACADKTILDDQAVRYVSLDGDSISYDCGGVTVSGSVLTIGAPGIYSLSGTLNDGQIIVNVQKDEKVEIELNGVTITCLTGPAIYVSAADKVTLDVADNTENTITSGTQEDMKKCDDSSSGAAIYSKDDLKIKGHGRLYVNGYINNGIASKNDVDIKSVSLHVIAANNGIKGNDSVEISDADVTVKAGNDGIKTDTTKEGKGFITITGTPLLIEAKNGIEADSMITVLPETQG